MKTNTRSGLKVRLKIKGGGLSPNHGRRVLKVRTAVKAGGLSPNHSRAGFKIKLGIKAGEILRPNHNRRLATLA